MKNMTRVLALMLSAVLLLAGVASAIEVVDPTATFYVADYANVLADETETYIVTKNDSLYNLTGGQIVVVTLDFLGGQDIQEYAHTLMNEWKIGSAEFNNGVLVLLVVGEANYWAVQGSGIELALTSSLLGDYLTEYLEPGFAVGNYDQGVMNMFDALLGWYSHFYNVDLSGANAGSQGDIGLLDPNAPSAEPPAQDGTDSPLDDTGMIEKGGIIGKIAGTFLIVVLVLAVLILVAVAVPRTVYLRRRGYHYGIFNRAFWSHRPPPPPRRPYGGPRPGPGPAPGPRMGGPRMGDPRPGGMGMGGAPRPAHFDHAGPRPGGMGVPRRGGGGVTRGGGASRSPMGGSRPGGSSLGGSRPSSRPRSGGGGRTRGGGAGRR